LAPYRLPLFPELTLERFAELPDNFLRHALFDYVLLHTWSRRWEERKFVAGLTPEFRAVYSLLVVDSQLSVSGPAFLRDPILRELARDALDGLKLICAHRCARFLENAVRAAAEGEDYTSSGEPLLTAWSQESPQEAAVAFIRERPDRFCATAEGKPPPPQ
jgi:hypothetical protein